MREGEAVNVAIVVAVLFVGGGYLLCLIFAGRG